MILNAKKKTTSTIPWHKIHDTIPFESHILNSESEMERERDNKNKFHIQIIKNVIQMCSHVIYSVKSRPKITLYVDFKPPHEWQFKRLGRGRGKYRRRIMNIYINIYDTEVRVFYPFDALIWVTDTHAHRHIAALNWFDGYCSCTADKWRGRKWERKKYPSTNFKISDKLYARASVIGLELHKAVQLPAPFMWSDQFVNFSSVQNVSIVMSSGGAIAYA